MKTLKLQKEKISVNRELIKKFGEAVYFCPEVESVNIEIKFKDGSNIGFNREEMEDRFHKIVEEDEE
ncbi:hypothetical protein J4402_02505 [Candidatus Pacearchaeota archaeon]|nr:hypothetical protein [Candidatus Pacearchaeota archaeon]